VNRHQWIVEVLVQAIDESILDLRVILGGCLESGDPWTAIANPGSIAPGQTAHVHLVVSPVLRPGDGPPKLPNGPDPQLLQLHHYGPLGQWIVEEYAWAMGAAALKTGPRSFRLTRFHIDHQVPGGAPFDLRFE
jgi:hypothetical protein